jgi:hypothetical protein
MSRHLKGFPVLIAIVFLVSSGVVLAQSDQGSDSATVWQGERMTFTKADGADPTLAENQDRITDSVWITRGNDGGQIYNIQERSSADYSASPVGTEWAVGTTDDFGNLEFAPFREAVGKPKDIVGTDLVLHIIEEDVYLDVVFTSWSQRKQGGFSYERTTR